MIYLFEDGRMLYDASLLADADKGNYLTMESLPQIPEIEGKTGVISGYDAATEEINFNYFDIPEPQSEPEPPLWEPTEQEVLQAEMLLNQQRMMSKQAEQDFVLAELLLNQQGAKI